MWCKPHGIEARDSRFLDLHLSFVYLVSTGTTTTTCCTHQRVNGATNCRSYLHRLFWLSLIPFTTAWMERIFEPWPVAVYGIVLLLAAVAYLILTKVLINLHGQNSTLATSIGSDRKQNFNRNLCGSDPIGIRAAVDCGRVLCQRGHHVADPRPPHREKAGARSRCAPQCCCLDDLGRQSCVTIIAIKIRIA